METEIIGCCNPHYRLTPEQQGRFDKLLADFHADSWIDSNDFDGWQETNQWQILYGQPLYELALEVIPAGADEKELAAHELAVEWATEQFFDTKDFSK